MTGTDRLPLIADVSIDSSLWAAGETTGCGSYIADFGCLDLPGLGTVRARAGLRYSRLYPHGALELGLRKEKRDQVQGYELSLGMQSTGDDRRLDLIFDVGAKKHFRGASVFYRLICGRGSPYGPASAASPAWANSGSSLGVRQTELPPKGLGQLTVGWRTGLFDNGLEGARMRPREEGGSKGSLSALLDSTPFAEYGLDLKKCGKTAELSCTLLPSHDIIEMAVRVGSEDASGGKAAITAIVDQSISCPGKARLRIGSSYCRS